jgi:hypothetical protein
VCARAAPAPPARKIVRCPGHTASHASSPSMRGDRHSTPRQCSRRSHRMRSCEPHGEPDECSRDGDRVTLGRRCPLLRACQAPVSGSSRAAYETHVSA